MSKNVLMKGFRKVSCVNSIWSHFRQTWIEEPSSRIMIALIGASIVAPTMYMTYAASYVYKDSVPTWEDGHFMTPEDIVARRKDAMETGFPLWTWYKPATWRYPPKSLKDLELEKKKQNGESV